MGMCMALLSVEQDDAEDDPNLHMHLYFRWITYDFKNLLSALLIEFT